MFAAEKDPWSSLHSGVAASYRFSLSMAKYPSFQCGSSNLEHQNDECQFDCFYFDLPWHTGFATYNAGTHYLKKNPSNIQFIEIATITVNVKYARARIYSEMVPEHLVSSFVLERQEWYNAIDKFVTVRYTHFFYCSISGPSFIRSATNKYCIFPPFTPRVCLPFLKIEYNPIRGIRLSTLTIFLQLQHHSIKLNENSIESFIYRICVFDRPTVLKGCR